MQAAPTNLRGSPGCASHTRTRMRSAGQSRWLAVQLPRSKSARVQNAVMLQVQPSHAAASDRPVSSPRHAPGREDDAAGAGVDVCAVVTDHVDSVRGASRHEHRYGRAGQGGQGERREAGEGRKVTATASCRGP